MVEPFSGLIHSLRLVFRLNERRVEMLLCEACTALGCRIDYLATHDYHGEVDLVMDRLKMLHER